MKVLGLASELSSIVKQPDACPKTHVIAPDVAGARARRPRCRPSPPSGRAERLAKSRFRGRPQGHCEHPVCRSRNNGSRAVVRLQRVRAPKPNRGLGSRFSPAFRTRMGLSACWMSQGWLFVPASPRSCELSPGHALEPSARYTVVCPGRSGKKEPPHALRCPASLRTSAPRSVPRRRSRHAPCRNGTTGKIFVLGGKSTIKSGRRRESCAGLWG